MPNFTPASVIYIGRVPFDNTYRHTRGPFASQDEQATWFLGRCDKALSRDDYTYVRMNNSIRVPYNAEALYNVNYCMYKNANYGNKWFYAFVTQVNYINDETTELVLELDELQTWYFETVVPQTFVEREHVSDDTLYAHTLAEPSMPLEWEYQRYNAYTPSMRYAIVQTNAYPYYSDGSFNVDDVDSGIPLVGGFYEGMFQGCCCIVYDTLMPEAYNAFIMDMWAMNLAGVADSIANIFIFPDGDFIRSGSGATDTVESFVVSTKAGDMARGTGVYVIKDSNYQHITELHAIDHAADFGGYTPRNNKLYCYPYQYIEVGDFGSNVKDYRWEFFPGNTLARNAEFKVYCPIVAETTIVAVPSNYNGISYVGNDEFANAFTVDAGVKSSWIYSAYQNWSAQNQMANGLAIAGSTLTATLGVVQGLGTAAGILGAGTHAAGIPQHLSNGGMASYAAGMGVDSAVGQVGAGLAGLATVMSNVDRMSRQPNETRGHISGSSKAVMGAIGFYAACRGVRREYAEMVDKFFDMYGYQVDMVKFPNRESRRSWNYVKCQNTQVKGNAPATSLALISSIYDSGITFWHTDDIGNYSLDNSIV